MVHIPRWKIFSILSVCILGILFAIPNVVSPDYLPSWLHRTINLGLELRGGSHLQYEVDLHAAAKDQSAQLLDEVRSVLRKAQIGYTGGLAVNSTNGEIEFTLREPEKGAEAKKLLRKVDENIEVEISTEGKGRLFFTEDSKKAKSKALIEQSIEVIRRRIDPDGTKEPIIQRQGDDRIIVQLPGVQDPGEVKRLIGKTAKMTFHMVDHSAGPIEILPNGKARANVPVGSALMEEEKAGGTDYVIVKKQVTISGVHLKSATAGLSQRTGQAVIHISFDKVGTRKFAEVTQANPGKRFAVVLDDKVLVAPTIHEPIPTGSAEISGNFTVESANELALLLRAGALPAPLKVIEERTVGASLGEDSISDGKTATLYAFIFVSVFMILCYATMGVIADIALIFNMILLFAALSLLQATLTLPGIAGIAVAIGMAVDANVLIYERIKEELRSGMRLLAAVDAGYRRAMVTIIDSNLTTLIGAAILYEFGTGPIRGFAVTLSLAIIISMFTAISLSRLIIVQYIKWTKATSISI